MTGKMGQYLRDNRLMGIKSRAAIPGGVCEFDLSAPIKPLLPLRTFQLNMLRSASPNRPLSRQRQ
jgi:cell division FtsZ-interacting protein ZapD